MDVLVFGAGSLGSLVGGVLARAHDVVLVGRKPHVRAVEESGLTVEGAIETRVRPRAVTDVPDEAFGATLVTVKAFDTAGAAEALANSGCDTGPVVSLQNGLGNEETLARRLDPVLAGACTYGARLVEPGRVACTGVGDVALGPPAGGTSPVAERVGEAFRSADVETTVATDMPRRQWEKLAVNAGVNAVTALARVENGALAAGPPARPARAAARETARVARSAGIDLSDDRALDAVESVVAATAENRSSMLQDVERGTRTEIDAINGAVVDRAEERVPVNETLAALVRAWERERNLR